MNASNVLQARRCLVILQKMKEMILPALEEIIPVPGIIDPTVKLLFNYEKQEAALETSFWVLPFPISNGFEPFEAKLELDVSKSLFNKLTHPYDHVAAEQIFSECKGDLVKWCDYVWNQRLVKIEEAQSRSAK